MARIATVLILALLLAGSAAAQGASDRQQAINEKIARLRDKIAHANAREAVLTSEISAVTARIRGLESDVAATNGRLETIERELAVYRLRLARLTVVFEKQTRRLNQLRADHELALRQLDRRLVEIYQSEAPTTVEVMVASASLGELLDQLDYLNKLGAQDLSIARQVAVAKRELRSTRERTKRTRDRVARATRAIEIRAAEEQAARDRLVASRRALQSARGEKRRTLGSLVASEREFLHEVAGLERASAALAARIRAAQSVSAPSGGPVAVASESSVSAQGMVWPVVGPVTSVFGWRWGRMHEGIDIAAASGTPIRASASGTVIYAAWMSGFGNLVVVDHGGGLSTAYAHQSSIGVGGGQAVVQGQTLGYVGCTGHCYGSHLHFEVRVNGSAVDPLGYL